MVQFFSSVRSPHSFLPLHFSARTNSIQIRDKENGKHKTTNLYKLTSIRVANTVTSTCEVVSLIAVASMRQVIWTAGAIIFVSVVATVVSTIAFFY